MHHSAPPLELFGALLAEGFDHVVEVVGEQCRVGVQRDLGRLVAEHALYHLDVGPGADCQRCRRVPQVVGRDPAERLVGRLGSLHGSGEPSGLGVARVRPSYLSSIYAVLI